MKEHTIQDLGTLVDIFMRGGRPGAAQIYLNEMQHRITAAMPKGPPPLIETLEGSQPKPTKTLVEIVQEIKKTTQPNEFLEQLPFTPIPGGALEYKSNPEPEEGMILDEAGNILAMSAQAGERGYDPNAHEKQIRIFCDGRHIELAHTADVQAGTVKYYKKDDRGRIKTLQVQGKVEIRAEVEIKEIQ